MVEEVNNVSLQIAGVTYGSPFSIIGEIENTTDLTVESFTIYFYGRDADGNPTYFETFSESTFQILPGGTAPFMIDAILKPDFETYVTQDEVSELYYYIHWQWTTSTFSELEVSPLTRLF